MVQDNSGNDLDYTISSFSSARYGAVACARGWSLVTKGACRPVNLIQGTTCLTGLLVLHTRKKII